MKWWTLFVSHWNSVQLKRFERPNPPSMRRAHLFLSLEGGAAFFLLVKVHFILFSFYNTLISQDICFTFKVFFLNPKYSCPKNEWNTCCWLNTNRKQWNQSSFSNTGLLECLPTQFSLFSFSHATTPRCDPVSTDPCVSEEWGQQRNSGGKTFLSEIRRHLLIVS